MTEPAAPPTSCPPPRRPEPVALAALMRASSQAIELARRTGTPAWVLAGDKLVDATQGRVVPATVVDLDQSRAASVDHP